jgi:hypothetical protein
MPNLFIKSRKLDNPYAIYGGYLPGIGDAEFRILKTYKMAKKEGPHARWFVAGKSDATFGSFEYGDTYKTEITCFTTLLAATPEWQDEYRPGWRERSPLPTPTEYLNQKEEA